MNDQRQRPWQTIALVLGFAFLYAPIAWIAYFSFSGDLPGGGANSLSLHWYRALLANTELRAAAYRSLVLALLSSPIAALLGSLAGIGLARLERFPGRSVMIALLAIPIFAPEILLGFSFLMLFASAQALTGWPQGKGMLTLVVAHATLGAPIVASVVFARVSGRDRSLEDAARDLGARPLRVLATITVPLAAPGILSGWLLALTLSFDDVVTSSFLAGPENTTLPMAIFSGLRVGLDPQINAVGTLMVAGVTAVVGISFAATRIGALTSRRRAQRHQENRHDGV
jgi:putrescine transport system permease protein